MGIPLKGSRAIVVAGARYCWRVTEPESWVESAAPWTQVLETRRLTLVVQDEGGRGSKLLVWAPVYRRAIRRGDVETPCGGGAVALSTPRQDTSVSPALVRRLIEHALHEGWRPKEAGADFVVPADAIDRLKRETVDARLLALTHALRDRVDVRLLTTLTRVGELRLMVELLCDQLLEDDRPLPPDALDQLVSLAGELGVEGRYTRPLAERAGSRPPET